ncbi:MAG: phospholipid carrier-dependent glycosyltransferase [Solirubrobacterales bacterium]|nr:phospholipid carrier-dependent glycosyltransferase [Solirubrobacterales bacterium]
MVRLLRNVIATQGPTPGNRLEATIGPVIRSPALQTPRVRVRRPDVRVEHLALPALCLICACALALRLVELSQVTANPFYDAAVRSMGRSWHNFFLGAFEPGGRLSIDKPAVDLWLQVLSVKVFGFGSFALKLPEALGGAVAVPLLYDTVRRLFGRGAGLAAAAALAVLPVSVLTSRSDTMDSVMMAFLVGAAWLTVRAAQKDRLLLICAAGAAIGVAFNFKLFEALVPVPALGLLYLLGSSAPWKRRIIGLAAAGAVLAAVSLSWVGAATLVGHKGNPYPIGSSNGTVWDVVFGFNGSGRLVSPASAGKVASAPSPTRLLQRGGQHYGSLLGSELAPAVLLGVLALLLAGRGRSRLERAGAVSLVVWLAIGVVLFSHMARLHQRYVEAFTPAIAAALGVGLAALATRGRREWLRVAATIGVLGFVVWYASYLGRGEPTAVRITVIAAVVSAVVRIVVALPRPDLPGRRALSVAVPMLATVACLALPAAVSLALVRTHASDAGRLALVPPKEAASLEAFLRSHRGTTRYDLATYDPSRVAAMIVDGIRPILPLSSWLGRPLVTLHELRARAAAGEVRYVLTNSAGCKNPKLTRTAGCLPAVRWVRKHGLDVSAQAGLATPLHLYDIAHR